MLGIGTLFKVFKIGAIIGGGLMVASFVKKQLRIINGQGKVIVALGDSITANGGYLKEIHNKLGSSGKAFGFTGKGIKAIAGHLAEVAAAAPDVVIVLAGVNDMPSGNPTVVTTALSALYKLVKATGARLVAVQVTPWQGYKTFNRETYLAVNQWIQDSNLPNAVVNTSSLGDASGRLKPEYDRGDHLHLNDAGQAELGRLILHQAFGQ